MSDLLALAERCEREEPSWQLDDAIAQAALGHPPCGTAGPRPYTQSIDAGVLLMGERGWGLTWDIESVHARGMPHNIGVCAYVWVGHMTNKSSFVMSPPVETFQDAVKWLPRLICAAALRARIANSSRQAA